MKQLDLTPNLRFVITENPYRFKIYIKPFSMEGFTVDLLDGTEDAEGYQLISDFSLVFLSFTPYILEPILNDTKLLPIVDSAKALENFGKALAATSATVTLEDTYAMMAELFDGKY